MYDHIHALYAMLLRSHEREKSLLTLHVSVSHPLNVHPDRLYLEERSILVPVVVLFARVFPRNPKDTLLLVLPHESRVFSGVHLLY